MSSYSLWELNMQELIQAFTTDELTAASVDAFLQGIGFDEVEITSLPMSAERRLLVYGNADYAFTSDDIHWLSAATVVVTGLCVEGLRVHVIELICDEDDYYTYCAALIKLFNLVFGEKSIFFFKLSGAFAVGSSRSFENSMSNSFCVSALIHATDVSQYADFLDELPYVDTDEIPQLIIRYSPQEKVVTPSKYFCGQPTDPDYLSFLDEVEAFYGESTQRERNRYLSTVEESSQQNETYKDTCKRLASTAENEGITSLEVLEDAESAEEKTAICEMESSPGQIEENTDEFSDEAYENAEVMLNELLGRDKN